MPFMKTNVSEQIELMKKQDPDFKKAWDEFHDEELCKDYKQEEKDYER